MIATFKRDKSRVWNGACELQALIEWNQRIVAAMGNQCWSGDMLKTAGYVYIATC